MRAFRPKEGVNYLKALTHPRTGRPLISEQVWKRMEKPGGPLHPAKLRKVPGVEKEIRNLQEAQTFLDYVIEQSRAGVTSERLKINPQQEREIRKQLGSRRFSNTQRDLQRRIEELEKGVKGEVEISAGRRQEERVRARPYASWKEKGRGATLREQLERETHDMYRGPQSVESPFSTEQGESTSAYLERIRRGEEGERDTKQSMREAIHREAAPPNIPVIRSRPSAVTPKREKPGSELSAEKSAEKNEGSIGEGGRKAA